MPVRLLLRALALAVLAAAGSCAVRTAPSPPTVSAALVFPSADWERIASPIAVGYCQDGLDRVTAKAKTLPTTAMMVVAGGRVLYEYGDVAAVSYLASVRKSVLAMLFGSYVASGKIRLDRTLADLKIDDVGGLSDAEKEATVRDLLGARSGVYHAAANDGDDLASAPPRGSQQHGKYFLYSNWDFNTLGTIFEQETGHSIYDALERDLARPIGMQDFDRGAHRRTGDKTKSIHLAYHMHLSTRDMARVGYLMLREGRWHGAAIVPREWVRRIATAVTPVDEMHPPYHRRGPFGYGYLWWVWDGAAATGAFAGAYSATGAVGQYITVLPKVDLVIAHKTRPGKGSVTLRQYLDLVNGILDARCTQPH